jgi:hypothetical protein
MKDRVLNTILDLCPNILILDIRFLPPGLFHREFNFLSKRCPDLRHLRLDCTNYRPFPKQFMALLNELRHLEILDLSFLSRKHFPSATGDENKVSLPRVHTAIFSVGSFDDGWTVTTRVGQYWDLPSLQYLSITSPSTPLPCFRVIFTFSAGTDGSSTRSSSTLVRSTVRST